MIALTRLNGTEMYLNADLVATVESSPDTVVTLIDGKHYVVRDSAAQVVAAVIRYRATVLAMSDRVLSDADADAVAAATPGRESAVAPVISLHAARTSSEG